MDFYFTPTAHLKDWYLDLPGKPVDTMAIKLWASHCKKIN